MYRLVVIAKEKQEFVNSKNDHKKILKLTSLILLYTL